MLTEFNWESCKVLKLLIHQLWFFRRELVKFSTFSWLFQDHCPISGLFKSWILKTLNSGLFRTRGNPAHRCTNKSTHSEMGPVWQNPIQSTARTCVRITVHNCHTQHNTEQFQLSSPLTSRQASQLRYCLLEGRGAKHSHFDDHFLGWQWLATGLKIFCVSKESYSYESASQIPIRHLTNNDEAENVYVFTQSVNLFCINKANFMPNKLNLTQLHHCTGLFVTVQTEHSKWLDNGQYVKTTTKIKQTQLHNPQTKTNANKHQLLIQSAFLQVGPLMQTEYTRRCLHSAHMHTSCKQQWLD